MANKRIPIVCRLNSVLSLTSPAIQCRFTVGLKKERIRSTGRQPTTQPLLLSTHDEEETVRYGLAQWNENEHSWGKVTRLGTSTSDAAVAWLFSLLFTPSERNLWKLVYSILADPVQHE